MGEVCMIPDGLECCLGQRQVLLRPDIKAIDPKFLLYALQSSFVREQIAWNEGTGSTVSNIRIPVLKALTIPTPARDVQEAAAEILGALDSRIDVLHQTNATLEAIAQALFKSWFVDFDPVRAKAEGREPEGMDAATAALFPKNLEDTEAGQVAAGWAIGTLADLSYLNASKWTARTHPETVRYIDLGAVRSNRIDPVMQLRFSDAPSRARQQLREGDTIVGTVRPGNRAFAYIHQPTEDLTGSTGFAVLSPGRPEASTFVYLAATRDEAIERLANLADGAAYPAVRPSVVADTACVIPPDSVLSAFSGITKPLLERIAQNSATAHALASLRDTLLPRLISGKLRLPDAERDIEAATA